MLRITLTKGLVAKKETHKKVIRALGLRKYGSSVVHHDSPTIRGMVNKVHYLVTVTEEKEGTATSAKARAAVKKAPAKKAEGAKPEGQAAAKPAAKAEAKAETKAKATAKAAK